MKKGYLFILFFAILMVLMACADEERVFENGDQVTRNGVIYTFVDHDELWGRNEVRVYDFKNNDKPLFHHFYYFDMLDSSQDPITPFERFYHNELKDHSEYDKELLILIRIMYYHRRTNDFFKLAHLIEAYTQHRNGVFFISGFTNKIDGNVRIPETIHGNNVVGIGYRAFENSMIRTFRWDSSLGGVILPYAFENSNNLREIVLPDSSLLLSKSITNLTRLRSLHGVRAPMEAALYNLPSLETISGIAFHFMTEYRLYTLFLIELGWHYTWITIPIDFSFNRLPFNPEKTLFAINVPKLRQMRSVDPSVEMRMVQFDEFSRFRRFYQVFEWSSQLIVFEILEIELYKF